MYTHINNIFTDICYWIPLITRLLLHRGYFIKILYAKRKLEKAGFTGSYSANCFPGTFDESITSRILKIV